MKRTALARKTPLTTRTAIKRRTPLAAQSAKRKKVAPLRAKFVRDQLTARPVCEVKVARVCRGLAVDIHEPFTRARGGSILDPANTLALCRDCHSYVHAHPKWANERGYLRTSAASGPVLNLPKTDQLQEAPA